MQPRFVVKIDGHQYIAESFETSINAHGATDSATVVMPIMGNSNMSPTVKDGKAVLYPDWTLSIKRTEKNAGTPVLIEIWAGEPVNPSAFRATNLAGLTKRFSGIVDLYSVQFDDNKTTFSCRSMAYPLTTNKIVFPFPRENSVTTVAFIQQQCKRFGIRMAPPNLVGDPVLMIDVFGAEFISGVQDWYIWDVILQCAQTDDVDVWVDRTGTLRYEAASRVKRTKIPLVWGEDIHAIDGTHAPQFSKTVRVTVRSYTKRTRTASISRVTTNADGGTDVSAYSRRVTSAPIFGTTSSLVTSIGKNGDVTTSLQTVSGGAASGSTGVEGDSNIEHYLIPLKNATRAMCQDQAQKIWRQISMHEYALKIDVPVTLKNLAAMDVTALLEISGLPMALFNTQVWPRQIIERLSPKSGWQWEIDTVNHTLPSGV
ncbi:MAG TPA: hypothetical protein VGF98_04970 [Candidatus Tumulicola sp.]|jgi:hypothetical protein